MAKEAGLINKFTSWMRSSESGNGEADHQTETRGQQKERQARERQMYKIIIEGLRAIYDLTDDGEDVRQHVKDQLHQELPQLAETFQARGWVEFQGRIFMDASTAQFARMYNAANAEKEQKTGKYLAPRSDYYVQAAGGEALYGWGANNDQGGLVHGISYHLLGFWSMGLLGKKFFGVFDQDFAQRVKNQLLTQ